MDRASFILQGVAAAAAPRAGRFARVARVSSPSSPAFETLDRLAPIDAGLDRMVRITVCTRPFRAAGPRIEVERVGGKFVVHNYGHGGSGWSLSWGSAEIALERLSLAVADPDLSLAVIGGGAIGLTTALTAQRMGRAVTIYTKDRFPFVRSARATGTWSPDSRVAATSAVPPDFGVTWERMARRSFAMYQSFIGAAGAPVEWTERYSFSDVTREQAATRYAANDPHDFIELEDRISDIEPEYHEVRLPDGSIPFGVRRARRTTSMTFNIASYARELEREFLERGGKFVTREFHTLAELSTVDQSLIANCTGYAARALCNDETLIPIRGQIAWLPPQEGVTYGLNLDGLGVLARRDGIAVQPLASGWNDDGETPDRAAALAGVAQLQRFLARTPAPRG